MLWYELLDVLRDGEDEGELFSALGLFSEDADDEEDVEPFEGDGGGNI